MQTNRPISYSLIDLYPFYVGKGTERVVFRNPSDSRRIIKISLLESPKQTRREIDYFLFLQKNQVPFTYIPHFYGKVKVGGFVGFEEEAILEDDGSESPCLHKYCQQMNPAKKAQVEKMLADLYEYLYQYNILPCDLTAWNIVVQTTAGKPRLVLIDGLGCTDGIPLAKYWKWCGRRKIARKWKRFMQQEIIPLLEQVSK